jgi:type IV fimbrial biogenesis protein FimT
MFEEPPGNQTDKAGGKQQGRQDDVAQGADPELAYFKPEQKKNAQCNQHDPLDRERQQAECYPFSVSGSWSQAEYQGQAFSNQENEYQCSRLPKRVEGGLVARSFHRWAFRMQQSAAGGGKIPVHRYSLCIIAPVSYSHAYRKGGYMLSPSKSQSGFSMIELMITIALLAVLLMLAQPSFESLLNGNRLTSIANELLATTQTARMESFRLGRQAVVCKSSNADTAAPTCDTTAGDWTGWIAFVDDGGGTAANATNGSFNAGETLLRVGTVSGTVVVTPSPAISATQRITFRSDGMSYTTATGSALLAGTLSTCMPTTNPAQNQRRLSIVSGSRISISRNTGGGACAAPPDL